MANSIITYTGNGVTTQYALNFTLGILKREYVQCRVGSEVDGLGDPVYRTLEWVTDGLVNIEGAVPGNGVPIVFSRTVPKDELIHDYSDGVPIIEKNLDESNKQTLMAIHEFLDGRLGSGLVTDLNMNDFLITNLGDGFADTDAANMGQLNDTIDAVADAVAETNADALQTAADRVQTGLDRIQTGLDRVQTGSDRTAAQNFAAQAQSAAAEGLYNDVITLTIADSPYVPTAIQEGTLFRLDTTGGNIIINLSALSVYAEDMKYGFVKDSADGNKGIVNRGGTDLINGITAFDVDTQFVVTFIVGDSATGRWVKGVQQAVINANDVDNTKLYDMVQGTVKMRAAGAGTGDPQDRTLAQLKTDLALAIGDTSGLQTALDAKLALAGGTMTGNLNVPSINEGQLAGNRNGIINGNMAIWQRGTSFVNLQAGNIFYSADRFGGNRSGDVVGANATRSTDAPSGFDYSLKNQRVAGNTAVDGMFIFYSMEIKDVKRFAGKQCTFSFYAKKGANYSGGDLITTPSYGTGAADARTYNFTGGGSLSPANIALTTAYVRYSITLNVPSNATQLGFTLQWVPTGTAGADDSVFYTGFQWEVGPNATPFEFRLTAIEQTLCERYFQKTFPYDTAPAQNTGSSVGALFGISLPTSLLLHANWRLSTLMRVAPTIVTYSPNNASANWWCPASGTASVPTVEQAGASGIAISGVETVAARKCFIHVTASAEF